MNLLAILLAAAAATAVPEHAVVLMYHHVAADTPPSTTTPPDRFAAHLDLLAQEGRTVVDLERAVAALRDPDTRLPDGAVALTFDDGYASVYTEAFPRLKERGWPFTVFVSPAAIDAGRGPACTWDQLREMAAAGATIASHGLRHEHLQRRAAGEDEAAWRARVRDELQASRARIAAEIGEAPPLLAYPYGEWSPALAELVAELGWIGCGQQSGPVGPGSDFRVLPRFPAAGVYADPQALARKLATLPLPVTGVEPRDPRVPLPPEAARARRPELRLRLDLDADAWAGLAAYEGGDPVAVERRGNAAVVPPAAAWGPGRARTNVTAPSAWNGRWYWYSHLWIVGEEHDD